MTNFAIIHGLLVAAYLIGWALLGANVILAILSMRRSDLGNAFLLWISSVPLFIVLWSIPRLHHYIGYGIHSKAAAYASAGHWLSALAAVTAVFIRGSSKWPALIAALLAFALVSLA